MEKSERNSEWVTKVMASFLSLLSGLGLRRDGAFPVEKRERHVKSEGRKGREEEGRRSQEGHNQKVMSLNGKGRDLTRSDWTYDASFPAFPSFGDRVGLHEPASIRDSYFE